MKHFIALFLLLLCVGCSPKTEDKSTFKLHLFIEPLLLDPTLGRSSSANYFFNNVLRGLYTYDNDKGLVPENGKCQWKTEKILSCLLSKDFKWSDGSPVTSKDYQRAFLHLIRPETGATRADLLIKIRNAEAILKGRKSPKELGFSTTGSHSFEVYFSEPDPEFIYKLTSTALLPKHKDNPEQHSSGKKFYSNGPYKIKSWKRGQQILLTKNEFYPLGHPQRPDVLMRIIDNDLTAFRLYERGQLNFLRRALPRFVQKLKKRDDFYQVPQARFDYIGFGAPVSKNLFLRKALALSINYKDSKKVLEALGPLGCPSLPSAWLDQQPCYPFAPKEAQRALKKVSPEILKTKLVYGFSMLGGPVLKRQAEFLQNQWKKNLGLEVELRMVEQKMYLKNLRAKPFPLFRKGVGLDRASCTDALETFIKGNSANYIQWQNKAYHQIALQLSKETKPATRKSLCRQAVEILMQEYRIIPLGEMHFTILARPQFRGWKLNELNQLDLSQLQVSHP